MLMVANHTQHAKRTLLLFADKNAQASLKQQEMILQRDKPTLMVPLDAVQNFAGVSKLFVLDNGACRTREVQVGRVKDGKQEVLSGLREGELVITSGLTKLYDGAKVRVKDSSDGRST